MTDLEGVPTAADWERARNELAWDLNCALAALRVEREARQALQEAIQQLCESDWYNVEVEHLGHVAYKGSGERVLVVTVEDVRETLTAAAGVPTDEDTKRDEEETEARNHPDVGDEVWL